MRTSIALPIFALALCPALLAGDPDDALEVSFKGKVYSLAELPGGLRDQQRADVEAWAAWAREHEYHLTLDETRRVLLVADDPGKKLKKELKLVADVLERADKLFPQPADVVPALDGNTTAAQPTSLPVLLMIEGDRDYASVLDALTMRHEYLRTWAGGARNLAGFVLSRPLCGAWLTRGADLEEWSPDNELINRLTRVLLLQRFGRMPEWVSQGMAWEMEVALTKGIYCFPRRNEFVFASEHSGWDARLASVFKKRTKEPVRLRELCALTRERFDGDAALLAFGAASFLVKHHADALVPLFVGLGADRDANGRRELGGGRWEALPEYDAPQELQGALLREHAGEDVLEDMTTYFRLGKRFRG